MDPVDAAFGEWKKAIVDKSGSEEIDRYIRSPEGLGWSWEPPYVHNAFQWCGAFVAFCWRAAGLHPEAAKYAFSSTWRLDQWHRYESPSCRWTGQILSNGYRVKDWHRDARKLRKWTQDPLLAEPGDILLLGSSGIGHHVALCIESPYDGYVATIEGNGSGMLGNGVKGVGVVRAERKLKGVRRVLRPSVLDLDPTIRYR